ncbi:MAG TPA: hypothetical protein VM554_12890 [Acidisarcina sp.]|nr:hypothetical protein [Acidisarcina sp.]
MSLVLITPPAAEPVTLAEVKLQLGFGPVEDSDRLASEILADKLRGFIVAARVACENHCRRAFLTQTWLLRLDGFPGTPSRYNWRGYPQIDLPQPPVQSIEFVRYVDTFGAVQDLLLDTTYGNGGLQYGYQLERGSETQPGRLLSAWARPWPPTRMVPSNVLVQFRCGYGGPLAVSLAAGSAALTIPGYKFNPADAPLLPGDRGLAVSIPGAGPAGATLVTNIASVDSNGNATLAAAGSTTVSGVTAWLGDPVPRPILSAVKMLVEFYYDHGGAEDLQLPRVVANFLEPYRNQVA